MSKVLEKFAERLKELRAERDLTQKKLEEASNIHRSSIANWEAKRNVPNLDDAAKLAKFFKVTLDYLAGLED